MKLYRLDTTFSLTEFTDEHVFLTRQQSHGLRQDKLKTIHTFLHMILSCKGCTEVRLHECLNHLLLVLPVAHGFVAVVQGNDTVTAHEFSKEALLCTDSLNN